MAGIDAARRLIELSVLHCTAIQPSGCPLAGGLDIVVRRRVFHTLIKGHGDITAQIGLDECVENPAPYDYVKASCERTARWLDRCVVEHRRLNEAPGCVNPGQMLFGINQGGTYADLRKWHMDEIAKLDCDGYAIGGLAVGEPTQTMYDIIEAVEPHMPKEKPRYLMGVGTPSNIIEGVARGVDFFDCVMPARNARHGKLYTCLLYTSGYQFPSLDI